MRNRLAVVVACLAAAGAAAEPAGDGRYLLVSLGSWHVESDTLNDFTPGIGLGRRFATARPGFEWHVESAVFYNSYEEPSIMVLGGASQRIGQVGPVELRLAGSVGAGYYKQLSERIGETRGLPSAGGFIPVAVLSLVARSGRTDVRLSTLPPDDDATAVFNLSIARRF